MPRQSSVRPRSSGKGAASASEASNAAIRSRQVTVRGKNRPRQRAAPALAQRTPETLRVRLVGLEVRASLLELAEGDQRLDRIGPDGERRVVHTAREQPPGKLAQVAAGRLEVAERELETAENTECS